MQLFQIPFSHNCVKVRRALDLKGLEYETVDINPAARRGVKRLSGQELVPVLVEQGRTTAGSTQILLDVEERHPDPPLLPADPRDRAESVVLMHWADAAFMDLTRRMAYYRVLTGGADLGKMFFPGRPAAFQRAGGAVAAQVLRRRFGISDAQNRRDLETARKQARVALDRLGDGEFLVGDRLTLADVTLAAMAAPLQYTAVAGDPAVSRLLDWSRGIMGEEFTPRQIRAAAA
ncbi:MAG TPA: glutathione S-transferase family protein [Solirubrobacterales bacterium]|nr:glutathione S-transferase family protein [Solirubrobacterales bacterium]